VVVSSAVAASVELSSVVRTAVVVSSAVVAGSAVVVSLSITVSLEVISSTAVVVSVESCPASVVVSGAAGEVLSSELLSAASVVSDEACDDGAVEVESSASEDVPMGEGALVGNTSSVVVSSGADDEAGDCVETSDAAMLVVELIGIDSTALEEAAVDASDSVVCKTVSADWV
jgi:hypothetical protein